MKGEILFDLFHSMKVFFFGIPVEFEAGQDGGDADIFDVIVHKDPDGPFDFLKSDMFCAF